MNLEQFDALKAQMQRGNTMTEDQVQLIVSAIDRVGRAVTGLVWAVIIGACIIYTAMWLAR